MSRPVGSQAQIWLSSTQTVLNSAGAKYSTKANSSSAAARKVMPLAVGIVDQVALATGNGRSFAYTVPRPRSTYMKCAAPSW